MLQPLLENICLHPEDRIVTVDIKRKTDAATECTKYRQTIYTKPLKDYSLSLREKASQKSGLLNLTFCGNNKEVEVF